MAQAIDDILRELDAGYNPQRQAINDRISQLQPQADAQVAGLKQEQTNAFGDITNGARDKGMGFSGIPIAEQAKYTGSTFLPAVAKVQQSVNDARSSLFDNLNNINLDQRKTAYGIQNDQLTREQAAAQAAAALKAQQAQNSAYSGLFSGGNIPTTAGNPKSASAIKRTDGGFNYTDAQGKPISAALYAKAKGVNIRDVLAEAARQGDRGAAQALTFVGADGGYDPNKVNNSQLAELYNSLFWGTGRQASPYTNAHPAIAMPVAGRGTTNITFPNQNVNQHPGIMVGGR